MFSGWAGGGLIARRLFVSVICRIPRLKRKVLVVVDCPSSNPNEWEPLKRIRGLEIVGVLGKEKDLWKVAKRVKAQEIVVMEPRLLKDKIFWEEVEGCGERGILVRSWEEVCEEAFGYIPIRFAVHKGPFLIPPAPIYYEVGKRILDLTLAVLGLCLMAFLLPFIALAIYLTDRGPIFYKQTRVGKGGKPFTLYKFRTMKKGAEREGQPQWATPGDPRVTPIGRFLRKSRLDEFPQFWNVLKGEMSIVGPRPERPKFVADLKKEIPFYGLRHSVKPGITGWAQVNYRYGSSKEDALRKLEYDLYYIKHRSLLLDLLVILRTIPVVLGFKGV